MLFWATQRLWYDGSVVQVNRPQNLPGLQGHLLYAKTSPIFATTKLADIERLRDAVRTLPGTNRPQNADASMIVRRLKVFAFKEVPRQPPSSLRSCGRCFAEFVLAQCRT